MKKKIIVDYKTMLIPLLVMVLAAGLSLTGCSTEKLKQTQPTTEEIIQGGDTQVPTRKFRVLHIMSYHASWVWNHDQFDGFKKGLEGLNVEYKVIEMDTKRRNSQEWKEQIGQEARDLIDTWQPDLVYANDDDAQEYVVKYFVNTEIPFVFSAVNASPEKYGFAGSTNVTGILEQEHFVETVQLLKEIVPDVKRIAVIVDESPMWDPVVARMKERTDQFPDIEFISWDVIYTFEEFKQKMTEYQTTTDAVGLIGIFNFKDEKGENVPFQEVLRWTAENSNLPDFSFWEDRISYGTLCAVTISGYEQGLSAGRIARQILEGRSPASFPMESRGKGAPVVSLARARRLNIPIKSDILLTAEVVTDFAWEE
jgi:ABC-type uncharacterized transport system substrate-binding protein